MLTHNQLIAVIRHIYPLITQEDHGRKYWVAMPVDGDTQTGPAWIPAWNFDFPQPAEDEITDTWDYIGPAFVLAEQEGAVRAKRDSLLRDLDAIVSNPMRWSALSQADQEAIQEYRQALLDVPQQEGFPNEISWPAPPQAA